MCKLWPIESASFKCSYLKNLKIYKLCFQDKHDLAVHVCKIRKCTNYSLRISTIWPFMFAKADNVQIVLLGPAQFGCSCLQNQQNSKIYKLCFQSQHNMAVYVCKSRKCTNCAFRISTIWLFMFAKFENVQIMLLGSAQLLMFAKAENVQIVLLGSTHFGCS